MFFTFVEVITFHLDHVIDLFIRISRRLSVLAGRERMVKLKDI